MKKYLMSMLALVLGIGMAQANPVGLSQAKYVGQQFVQASFDQTRQSSELTLVYTGNTNRGEACFYVFNVGNEGYVIVSADDFYRPIVAYSEEGTFDAQNINPEFGFMLDKVIAARNGKLRGSAEPQIAAEWTSVMNTGRLISRNGGREKFYLVKTKWDQNYPYNYYCPNGNGGPGGHVYAGCVATAMSQVMKYWDYPTQGTGSYSYYCPGYGQQSANFGATTYDWANMPIQLGNSSPQEQIDAVATLMYHCGVAVDMSYAIDGSGSYSDLVPPAIRSYFGYSNQAVKRNRDGYSYVNWANMLKESFDMGWPVYYSGQGTDGGHAFVCDGYDDYDLFHFNWGWSGSGDNYFDFDNIDYNSGDAAIFNFVPSAVYDNTPQAPTNLTVTPAPNYELAATLTWTNPSKTLNNSNLSSIDRIVVTRNGEIVYTQENATPGASVTITDNSVPRFDAFDYVVYAVYNGAHGKVVRQNAVVFGPSCGWTINISQAAFQGFRGGLIHIYNSAGTEIGQVTTTSSNVQSISVDIPLGLVSFGWTAPTQTGAFNMAFTIKNSQNVVVYTYSGSSEDFAEGIFYAGNNGCGNQPGTSVPTNLYAIVDSENENNINVSWDGVNAAGYGYIVYRDGLAYRLIPEGTSFVDVDVPMGGHCYCVGYLYDGGENGMYSNESCATAGVCYPPTNIDYEYTGANYKIKLKWEKPVPADELSGYYLYRKFGEDGEYTRVKLLGANATNYTDNSANQEGDYYYKLYAVYNSLGECISSPANWKYDQNQFFIKVLYSADAVGENEAQNVTVYPNPAKDNFTVNGEALNHISVYNTIGQLVYSADCEGNSAVISLSNMESGVYVVRVATENGTATKRITVIR